MLDVDFSRPTRVEQPSASCLLLRRSVIAGESLLDEEFPIYFNDVELAHRLGRQGHELWMTPESRVLHVHGASTRQLGSSLRPHHLGSLVRYLRRTSSGFNLLVFRIVVALHAVALRLVRRSEAPPLREVFRGLRGELGPLPRAPRS